MTLVVIAAAHVNAGDEQLHDAFARIKPAELRRDLEFIASDDLGGRGAGYEGERRAAAYAARSFSTSGLTPMGHALNGGRDFEQEFPFYPQHAASAGLILKSRNVLGLLQGVDPKLKHEVVVIGAHHDGQGQAGEADPGRLPPCPNEPRDTIWNSADDNGSGMTAVLAIARALHASGLKTRRSILFATFGAEEHGLVGSIYYVNHPVLPWPDHVAMLTLEQLGREPRLDPIVMATGTSAVWDQTISWANTMTGMHVKVLTPELIQDTDHYGFGVRGVPALSLGVEISPDAHRPSDSADKIDYERLAARTRYVLAVVLRLADMPQRPMFAGVPPCPASSLGQYLAERCSRPEDPGMSIATLSTTERNRAKLSPGAGALKVIAAVKGLPGEQAGLRAGDLIVGIDGKDLAEDVSFRYVHEALRKAPQQSSWLRVKRGLQHRDIELTSHAGQTTQ